MTQDHIRHRAGVYAAPRQPQGDFGRGKDEARLGSSDDGNRELNKRGAYRDAEPPQEPATTPRPRTPGRPSQDSATPDGAPHTKSRPRRAESQQPDRPGRGDDQLEDERDPAQEKAAATRKAREQSQDALDNVRDGYDR